MRINLVGSGRSSETEAYDDGDEEATSTESSGSESKSRLVAFIRGATVFLALFAVLRWVRSRNEE